MDVDNPLALLQATACTYRIALGPRAGQQVLSMHLIRFHGVLAPNARLRAAVVPGAPQDTSAPEDEHAYGASARMCWARLPKRVFNIDLEHCP